MENTDVLIKGGNILKSKVMQAIDCSKRANKNESDRYIELYSRAIKFSTTRIAS